MSCRNHLRKYSVTLCSSLKHYLTAPLLDSLHQASLLIDGQNLMEKGYPFYKVLQYASLIVPISVIGHVL